MAYVHTRELRPDEVTETSFIGLNMRTPANQRTYYVASPSDYTIVVDGKTKGRAYQVNAVLVEIRKDKAE